MPRRVSAKVDVYADAQITEARRSVDWRGVWSLPMSAAGVALAAMVYFATGDKSGAAYILIGVATLIGVILRAGVPRTS